MRLFLFTIISFLINSNILAQGCCSGGSSSPIAGGAASGVLQEKQMEISINYQFNKSNTFFSGHTEVNPDLNQLITSDYLFFRTDYGLSRKFTFSLAAGYYLDKSLINLDYIDTTSSSGLGDVILFPRYSVYNKTANFKRTEITLGLGIKIPFGTHKDSTLVYFEEWSGESTYSLNPPTAQITNGSNDFMFYSFFFREYQKQKLRIFTTTLYARKGFNSSGIKFGDYASVGFFASKTFFWRWGVTTQIKAEYIAKTRGRNDDLSDNSIYPESTGSKKWFFIPQLSYSQDGFTAFLTSEIPLYQKLNGTQIGSQNQFTVGVNYRFLTKACEDPPTPIN